MITRVDGFLVQPWLPPDESLDPSLTVRIDDAHRTLPSFHLSTDTYFGRFPVGLWRDAAGLRRFIATGQAPAGCIAWLMTSGDRGITCVQEAAIDDDGWFTFEELTDDHEFAWVEFLSPAHVAPMSVSVSYLVDTPPLRSSRTGIGICTFDRPDSAGPAASAVLESGHLLDLVRLVVVDQGTDRFAWDGLQKHGRLTVIEQLNLGGAGGFARAIAELAPDDVDCIVLMDDDICIHASVLQRILALYRHASEPAIVATQMLNLRRPSELLYDAETIDMAALWSRPVRGSRIRAAANRRPRRWLESDMAPWWCALLPIDAVRGMGLPLPFFLHWDDIEYSLRASRHLGVGCLTLPGAGVWHEPFDATPHWGWTSYFNTRNRVAAGAAYGSGLRTLATVPVVHFVVALATHRYLSADAALLVMDDLRRGPAILSGNQRTRLMERLGTVTAVTEPSVDHCRIYTAAHPPNVGRLALVLRVMARALFPRRATQCVAGDWPAFGRAIPAAWPYVIVRSRYGGVLEVLVFDRKRFWRTLRRGTGVTARYLLSLPRVRRRWRDLLPGLAATDAWERQWLPESVPEGS
jgi:galactofuranosylgalactofuranosylrhamnosyl-N-acetylglucosaminyl-diphospho-decaprenol beta-1,5/1,6-galactofuranosyltransferase